MKPSANKRRGAASEENHFLWVDETYIRQLLQLFPNQLDQVAKIKKLRLEHGLVDMKRGELYPEIIAFSSELRRAIARTYEVDLEQAQPNFGCNGCIDSFFSFLQGQQPRRSRGSFLVAVPTYFRYHDKANNLGFEIIDISFNPDGSYPVEKALSIASKLDIDFLLLVTPNNPTGVPISDDEIIQIIEGVPDDLVIVIDRTCVNIEHEIGTKDLIRRFRGRKLVIFHSFSKYYGYSHHRIGFSLVANRELALQMQRYLPFGLNLHATLLAIDVLQGGEGLRPNREIIRSISANEAEMLRFLDCCPDFQCTGFKSNYAVITLPQGMEGSALCNELWRQRISVMPGEHLHGEHNNTIRIHCGGPPTEFGRMLEAIESFLRGREQ